MVYYVNMKISDGCCIICCIVSIIWCITPLICSMFSIDIPYCVYIYTYVVLCVVFTQMECINQETHHWGIPATPGRTCPPATCRAAASRSFSSTTRAIYRVRDDRFAGDGWESSFPVFSQGESMRKCYNISITNDSGSGYNWL